MTDDRRDDNLHEQLGRDLTEALTQQADRFEPRAESFLRLQQAVDERSAHVTPFESGRRRFPGRYFAAAALVCATVGGVAVLANTDRGTELQTVPADSTEPDPTITTTTMPVTTTTAQGGATTEAGGANTTIAPDPEADLAIEDQLIAGPRRATREAAVRDFMALIRLRFARIDFDGDTATVFSFDPDGNVGQPSSVLTLVPVRLSSGADGFAVARAEDPSAAIESPAPGTKIDGAVVTVSGTGQGFEGGVGVRIYSSFDGLLFDMEGATAGNFDGIAPYSADLRVTGREMGWVVVQSSTGADVTAPFSAVPIEWDAGPDPTTYTVSHIRPDDPDEGLNIRNLPTGSVLDTLSPGTTIRRRGDVPSFVGSQVWWSVTTEDGLDGWVNRRFLVRDGDVSDETLELIADQFLNEFATLDGEFATILPWSTTKPVKIGWAPSMTDVDPAQLRDPAFWEAEHEWMVPEATFPEPVLTARFSDLLGFPLAADGSSPGYSYIPGAAGEDVVSPYPLVAEAIETQFAGASQVSIAPVQSGFDGTHPTFTLFIEPGPDGATIVGVAIDFFIP